MFIRIYSNIYLSYNIHIHVHQVSCSREEPYIYILVHKKV